MTERFADNAGGYGMRYIVGLLTVWMMAGTYTVAQNAIQYDASQHVWQISAGEMSYVLGVNNKKGLQSIYWGPKLEKGSAFSAPREYPEAASFDNGISTTPLDYVGWGGGLPYEPDLKISFPDGNRSLLLEFADAKVSPDELEITLKDALAPVYVRLFYHVWPQGILGRWSRVENRGKDKIIVEQAESATWNLPPRSTYELSSLSGRWGAEWQLQTEALHPGAVVLESRRGSTSHQANPWFAIGSHGETTENAGPVWFGELGWSGSWRFAIEQTFSDRVRITGGTNPFDFAYPLAAGESLETPKFYAGYTGKGQGEASRILHRFQREEILPQHPTPKLRPVLFNSWEATEFAVDEKGQIALAEKAAKLGVERMVIDDGWFGQRNSDHAGLGDWTVNPQKFPNGLKPMIDRVHALGMDFGIWVEPEMVNPDSDLYRKHPDWAMNFPGRPRIEARNQLMLNLAREDVRQYVFNFLDKLVSENDIAFLKWDYNRNWTDPGWDSVPLDQQKEIYIKFVDNLYGILADLRRKHPKLEIESCSGGGGRVDLGILRYTDEVWPSDNTDALDRLVIQDGFTHAYSPNLMMAWVTDVPNRPGNRFIPLEFRFLVAMSGSLGIGGNLNNWSPDDMAKAKEFTSFYKQVRPTVQLGELHRLMPPENSETSAVQYVSADRQDAVVFAYLHSQHYHRPFPVIHLEGLDPKASYRLIPLDAKKIPGLPAERNGSQLMGEGLQFNL
ncbi:MAG: alpha-galactosidase, partial [Granulicella sp.]